MSRHGTLGLDVSLEESLVPWGRPSHFHSEWSSLLILCHHQWDPRSSFLLPREFRQWRRFLNSLILSFWHSIVQINKQHFSWYRHMLLLLPPLEICPTNPSFLNINFLFILMRYIFILLVSPLSIFGVHFYRRIFFPKHCIVKLNRELLGGDIYSPLAPWSSVRHLLPGEHFVFVDWVMGHYIHNN